MRQVKFNTILAFRNLLARQMKKDMKKPIKKASEVMMLIDAILYDYKSLDEFYTFGSDMDVYIGCDEKGRIVKIKAGK